MTGSTVTIKTRINNVSSRRPHFTKHFCQANENYSRIRGEISSVLNTSWKCLYSLAYCALTWNKINFMKQKAWKQRQHFILRRSLKLCSKRLFLCCFHIRATLQWKTCQLLQIAWKKLLPFQDFHLAYGQKRQKEARLRQGEKFKKLKERSYSLSDGKHSCNKTFCESSSFVCLYGEGAICNVFQRREGASWKPALSFLSSLQKNNVFWTISARST